MWKPDQTLSVGGFLTKVSTIVSTDFPDVSDCWFGWNELANRSVIDVITRTRPVQSRKIEQSFDRLTNRRSYQPEQHLGGCYFLLLYCLLHSCAQEAHFVAFKFSIGIICMY